MDMKTITGTMADRDPGHDRIIVSLSGGVDSSLVAAAALHAFGSRVVGVTVHSELTIPRDFTRAVEVAEHLGIEHHPLPLRMLEDKLVRRNSEERCYHCKKRIFKTMILEYGDDCMIMDGTNAEDDPARPGLGAAKEFGVFSPLAELGVGKQKVRQLARQIGLPNWNWPSESCLATRIPFGIPLSQDRLDKVDAMESFFHGLGIKSLRARHDNLVATVEYLPQYAEIIEKNRDKFAALIERIGLRSFIVREGSE